MSLLQYFRHYSTNVLGPKWKSKMEVSFIHDFIKKNYMTVHTNFEHKKEIVDSSPGRNWRKKKCQHKF